MKPKTSRARLPKSALLTGAVNRLREFFDGATKTREPYRPKYCRTKGCTLEFAHDEPHNVATGKVVDFYSRQVRDKRTGKTRPVRKNQARGYASLRFETPKARKPLRDPMVAARMAEYRRRPVKTDNWKRS